MRPLPSDDVVSVRMADGGSSWRMVQAAIATNAKSNRKTSVLARIRSITSCLSRRTGSLQPSIIRPRESGV